MQIHPYFSRGNRIEFGVLYEFLVGGFRQNTPFLTAVVVAPQDGE